jgi:WD40 repeat protein
MNSHCLAILCGVIFLACLFLPVVSATDPLWTERATTSGELSGITISADGSTIVAGGDQLIALSSNGKKLWSGWSGTCLAISQNGNYIVTARDDTFRLISGTGTMIWDEGLGVPVEDVAMTPNASFIAAGGGSRVKVMSGSGAGIKLNTSLHVNHLRLFPEGDGIVVTSAEGVQTSNLTLYTEWADTNVTQDFVEVAGNGSSFVTVTNNRIRKYARDGSLQWDCALPGGNALASAYSRDGSMIVVGRDDNTLTTLGPDGTVLWTTKAAHWVTSVAVSDDGNTIAAGSMDRTLSVYDRAGTKLGSFTAQEPIKARSVAMSGDGSVIAAVDASNVYGFSRSQFTEPAATTVTAPGATVTTPAPATTVPLTPPPVIRPPTTIHEAVPVYIPLAGLLLLLLCRSRKL